MIMSIQSGFQLTPGDVQILTFLYEFRFLHIGHLIDLTQRRHQMIHRRLLKLIERHFIARITPPSHKHIYTLGRAGSPLLVEQGLAPKEIIDARLRHHELKDLFLKHTLMVVDLHVALERATRDSHIKLVSWKQGVELFDRVTIREPQKTSRLPVRPDGAFSLEDTTRDSGKNHLHFVLEADRSTTTHERFHQKLKAYWHYFAQGQHTKKYAIKSIRVVIVTLTKERAANLRESSEQVVPQAWRKYFLFTTLQDFLTSPFEDICGMPHDPELHRLIPQAASGNP